MDVIERAAKRRRFGIPHQSCIPPVFLNSIPLCAQEQNIEPDTIDTQYTSGYGICQSAGSFGYPNGVGEDVAVGTLTSKEKGQLCYGMLSNIPVKLKSGLYSNSKNTPVFLQSTNKLSSPTLPDLSFEITCSISSRILDELASVEDIDTQLYCHSNTVFQGGNAPQGRRRGRPLQSWALNAIIFGTDDLVEVIGELLSKHQMYLQDPVGCERSVLYRNPHLLSPESEESVMADTFNSLLGNLEIEKLEAGPDLLAQLMEEELPLLETEAPAIVKTPLFAHQKKALTFMIRREKGWSLEDSDRDIWSGESDAFGRFTYKNNVNGFSTHEPPPSFRGGLLADDMGLGKTLSMISLIAYNQANRSLPSPPITHEPLSYISPVPLKSTLLVVPPALIQAWENQFQLHLRRGTLKYHVYHGKNRKEVETLGQFDVVISTYHTISTIWRQCKGDFVGVKSIFSMAWHRLVIDEAHIVQNPGSDLAQACCAIQSERRWAITGTPIQNKLTDFASIVKFLQVYPYADTKVFEEEIFKPWQNRHGADPQGFLRLKTLVRAITISRSKAVVQLPHRTDEVHHLDFTAAERTKYEATKVQARALLEDAISSGNKRGKMFNALWLLNMLRLVCNHGLLARSGDERNISQVYQGISNAPSKQIACDSFYSQVLGATTCSNCGANLLEELLEGLSSAGLEEQPQSAPSAAILCEACSFQLSGTGLSSMPWHHNLSGDNEGSIGSGPAKPAKDENPTFHIEGMSTKIKALVADLCKHCATEKSVVFSYWTYTLDLVQLMLDEYGILYTRIDGKATLSKRAEALRSFKQNDSIRVILVSITCGGAGLDLTAASRAYLLEPHWNPMMEEQALCRVHRVGQQRDVTTIRYLMRGSFEEQMVDTQKQKKMLAQVTFGQGSLPEAGIGLGTLQYLKSVLQ